MNLKGLFKRPINDVAFGSVLALVIIFGLPGLYVWSTGFPYWSCLGMGWVTFLVTFFFTFSVAEWVDEKTKKENEEKLRR